MTGIRTSPRGPCAIITSFAPVATISRTILWICYGTYFVLFFFLFWKVTQVVQKIRPVPAFLIGSGAFVVYQSLYLVFNR